MNTPVATVSIRLRVGPARQSFQRKIVQRFSAGDVPLLQLAPKGAEKIEAAYQAFVCDDRKRLPPKFQSDPQLSTKIKGNNRVRDDVSL